MGLSDFLKNLFSTEHVQTHSQLDITREAVGLRFTLPQTLYNQAMQSHADNLTLHQYLRMQMLLEEGIATPRDCGIWLPLADCAALDADSRHIFALPPVFPGSFSLVTQGISTSNTFALQLHLHLPDGEVVKQYDFDGIFLSLSEAEKYLPDTPQWQALSAIKVHKSLTEKNEYDNLDAIQHLLKAADAGLNIDKAAFKDFQLKKPDSVKLAIEVEENGDLTLMPAFGDGLAQDKVQQRLGQIDPDGKAQSLRVDKTIVLLDEERLKAAHEIIRKRHVPAAQRRKFFAAPASYLDAAMINLDAGFSIRVKGAGPFLHAYFGETYAGDIQWFDQGKGDDVALEFIEQIAEDQDVIKPEELPKVIKDAAVLGDFKQKLADAKETSASVVRMEDWRVDISDNDKIYAAMEALEEQFETAPAFDDDDTVALDIHLNDIETEHGAEINSPSKGFQSEREVDFSPYTRSPFPHQVEGIRWMLGLALNEGQPLGEDHRIQGCLLADDMGLGKTYMSIVGIREILLHCQWQKPVLIVAPLSLLENWKREVQETYKEPFFNRFVILQSDGDLSQYRMTGYGVETKRRQSEEKRSPPLGAADAEQLEHADDLPPWDVADNDATNASPVAEGRLEPSPSERRQEAEVIEAPMLESSHMLDSNNQQVAAPDDAHSPQAPLPADEGNNDDIFARQRSLKIGPEWGPDRLDLPGTLVLATYQTMRDYQFSLASIPWSVVVFDEAQNIKSPNTLQTRAAKALNAEFKLLVTGTPVENHLGEFWCLFDTMQPGFLGSYQAFRQEYIKPILRAAPDEIQQVREDIGQQLRDRVGGFMLRRNKEDHLKDMPTKTIILGEPDDAGGWTFDPRITTEMRGGQRLRYEDVMSSVISEINDGQATSAALRGLQQLRDVSLFPGLIAEEMPPLPRDEKEARAIFEQSGKLKIVLGILEEVKRKEEKILIFIVNKRLQELMSIAIGRIFGLRVHIINGETKAVSNNPNNPTRQGIIDKFQATEGFNALVISPVAAGVGLTIVAANHVIHLERHWNPAKEAQATDRAYRIGQKKDVFVYIPILTHPDFDSFDVNLNRLLSSKQSLKDAIITQEEVHAGDLMQSGVFVKKE
jgi:SNF2 family DNA or RNA helicase